MDLWGSPFFLKGKKSYCIAESEHQDEHEHAEQELHSLGVATQITGGKKLGCSKSAHFAFFTKTEYGHRPRRPLNPQAKPETGFHWGFFRIW